MSLAHLPKANRPLNLMGNPQVGLLLVIVKVPIGDLWSLGPLARVLGFPLKNIGSWRLEAGRISDFTCGLQPALTSAFQSSRQGRC